MAPSAQQIKHCFGTRQFIAILFSSITQETARRGSSAWHKQWVPDARESLHLLLSAWRALVKSGCVFLGRGCVSGWVVGRRPPRAALVPADYGHDWQQMTPSCTLLIKTKASISLGASQDDICLTSLSLCISCSFLRWLWALQSFLVEMLEEPLEHLSAGEPDQWQEP